MGYVANLREAMDLSIVKREQSRAASLAISDAGNIYHGAQVDSNTKLLSIAPEQVALLSAAQHNDYIIEQIISMQYQPEEGSLISPIVLKTILDFARRTGQPIGYTLIDTHGNKLFGCDDVCELSPFYRPPVSVLGQVINAEVSENRTELDPLTQETVDLKGLALKGLARSFTTEDNASSYGSAVVVDGSAYFSGQYSSFEGRLNIHAEMAAILAAFMEGHTQITDIGVVSTKHKHQTCRMCAACVQFLSEMVEKFKIDPTIHSYAYETDEHEAYKLTDYLPLSWSPQS